MIKKILLLCGIAASLLYVAMNIIGAMQYPGYSSVSQTISELSAIGAPSRPTWLWLGPVYDVLVIAFGAGIWMSGRGNRNLRKAGALFVVFGGLGAIWPFASMHQREVLAAGGGTFADTLHLVLAGISVFTMFLAIWFAANSFGKNFRDYSIATVVVLLAFGVLTGMGGPNIGKNLPTPFVGVWERINLGVFFLWSVVLAIMLLREKKAVS
jgi:hypothetical protein